VVAVGTRRVAVAAATRQVVAAIPGVAVVTPVVDIAKY
jgi:hypothetical protein